MLHGDVYKGFSGRPLNKPRGPYPVGPGLSWRVTQCCGGEHEPFTWNDTSFMRPRRPSAMLFRGTQRPEGYKHVPEDKWVKQTFPLAGHPARFAHKGNGQ